MGAEQNRDATERPEIENQFSIAYDAAAGRAVRRIRRIGLVQVRSWAGGRDSGASAGYTRLPRPGRAESGR